MAILATVGLLVDIVALYKPDHHCYYSVAHRLTKCGFSIVSCSIDISTVLQQ